jgi:hypothetical protein
LRADVPTDVPTRAHSPVSAVSLNAGTEAFARVPVRHNGDARSRSVGALLGLSGGVSHRRIERVCARGMFRFVGSRERRRVGERREFWLVSARIPLGTRCGSPRGVRAG